MNNDTKFALILFLLMACMVVSYTFYEISPEKTTGEIEMLQPCGWPWCMEWDAQYADNNLKNAQANMYNSEGELLIAQAENVKARTDRENLPLYIASILASFFLMALVVLVLGGLSIAAFARKR